MKTHASEDDPGDAPQFGVTEDEMKIQIRGRSVGLTEVQRTQVERRLGFAFGRFGDRIGRVLLRFSDTDGHHGDLDKRCQIDVSFRPRTLRVEDSDADLFVAIDRAADRASRSVARALERERGWEESPPTSADCRGGTR